MAATSPMEKLATLGISSGPASTTDGVSVVETHLLKDKHGHVYAIVALSDTDVSLKVLSTRLGLGKAPLAAVPLGTLPSLLQSPSHCTFLGLAKPAAREIVSLLDARLAERDQLRVPAADGSGEITMSGADVEKFLRSLGGTVSAVDLLAAPKIDREHPPDLKQLADGATVVAAVKNAAAAAPAAAAALAAKPAAKVGGGGKAQPAAGAKPAGQPAALDVDQVVNSIVSRCLSFGGGQQSATEDSEAMRVLLADVRMEINSLKNAAYASGFTAARGALRAQLEASFP